LFVSIRETLNNKPAVVTGVTIGIVVIALVAILLQSRREKPAPVSKAYYTTDDGATVFEDDLEKTTPFPHDGGSAVQAHMFSCDDGRTKFVGFLEKLPDKLPQATAAHGHDPRMFAALVKAPKNPSAKWVNKTASEGIAVIAAIKCPDGGGSGPAVGMFPK
jgi:hypothetical protein